MAEESANLEEGPRELAISGKPPPSSRPSLVAPKGSKGRVSFPKRIPLTPSEDQRPLVDQYPPIWASVSSRNNGKKLAYLTMCHQTRAEICETLDYFRTYQAGVYCENQSAIGYLLDGFPSSRDYCSPDARVIISHGSVIQPLPCRSPSLNGYIGVVGLGRRRTLMVQPSRA